MKTIKILSIVLFVAIAQMTIVAQKPAMHQMHQQAITTTTFKVYGECEMCKARIEGALKTPGISKANWNQKNKMLTVSYDASKIKLMDIHKRIAAVGHDTEKMKASDKAYKALPSCCQYDRKN